MYQAVIGIIQKEVIRLIYDQIHAIFAPLLETPDFFNTKDRQRNISPDLIQQWTEIIKDEVYKVKRFEATFVIVGTMKAGKSTTINAIVGTELLPNRNQPMTMLPTVIRHCPGKKEPELIFPNPQPFNALLNELRGKLKAKHVKGELEQIAFSTMTDGKELIHKILDGSLSEFRTHYQGTDAIFAFLKYANDMLRLCSSDDSSINIDEYLYPYHKIHELPTIELEFFHLRNQNFEGSFALIDTPGPNEAGHSFLKSIMQEQLEKSSVLVTVLDYTQMNAEAEADIRRSLNEITHLTPKRLFVLVNKFDQKDRHGMNLESLRSYVATQLFADRVDKNRVFPVSSKYAYLANRALNELCINEKLADYKFNPWIEDFGQLALGMCWESEIDNVSEIKNRAVKLWNMSLFDQPLTQIVKNGSANAAIMSLKAAIAKMLDYDKQIIEHLQFRLHTLQTDIDVIETHIKSLEADIQAIKRARTDLRLIIARSISALQEKAYKIFDQNEASLQRDLQTVFNQHKGDNWLVRRLIKYMGENPAEIVHLNLEDYHNFPTEEDARKFLGEIANIVMKILQQTQQDAKSNVDDILTGIWREVTGRLEPILKTTEERLYEAFAVLIDFPKPTVKTSLDLDKILHSSLREGSITKTGTKRARKWYTLWSREHEVTYLYREQTYRIYIKDVLEQLQQLLKEDSDGLWASLDKYVQTEFTTAISTYFAEVFDYLERLKEDLIDSKYDQELESERIEHLHTAMKKLLRNAEIHWKDVQSLGKGFLIKSKAEKTASISAIT